jgi:hypothetical protein
VYEEIHLAKKIKIPVKYFELGKTFRSIREIDSTESEYEEGVGNI